MRPLEGIKVVDFTDNLAGSHAALYLANFGAEVIKIEKPETGSKARKWEPVKENKSLYFEFLNRGKKSVTLDITKPEGQEIAKKLIKQADVVTESYEYGFLDNLGLGYEDIKNINPNIIYASQSYYGHTGPYKAKPGSSCTAQAYGVAMDMTGVINEEPIKAGPPMGEHYAAGYMATGVVFALINRKQTGKGQKIDVALLDSLFSTIEAAAAAYSMIGEVQSRKGNFDPACAPYDSFETNDGYVSIGVANELQWQNLCKHVINMPELIDHPVYGNNAGRCEDYLFNLRPILADYIINCSKYDIERLCREVNIPSGEVLDIPGIVEHPHVSENDFLIDMSDESIGAFKAPRLPIDLSETPAMLDEDSPDLGQHTEEFLNKIGYMDSEIKALKEKHII